MNIEYMKNLIYTFVGSMALVLLTGCSAEFENGTPEPWQREINPNENYEYTIKPPNLGLVVGKNCATADLPN